MEDWFKQFIILWSVIDPIGTVPVFLAVTAGLASPSLARKLA
ncbi:MarC family protein, partial [Marinomonas sp.]